MACGFTTGWQSWVQLENMSAWHNQEFATKQNGFGGFDAKLVFNNQLLVRHIAKLSSWVKSGLFTYAGRQNQPEAKFFTYMSSPQVQAEWHQKTGYVPITKAAYELTKKQGFYDANPGTDVAIEQLLLKNPTKDSKGIRLGNFVQIRGIIDEELESVWSQKKSPKQALDDAVERGNAELRKFERANKAGSR